MPGKMEFNRIVRIVIVGIAVATVLFSLTEPRQGQARPTAGADAPQTSAADPQSFETASIRPSGQATRGTPVDVMQVTPGGRWTASAVSARKLMETAFDVKPFQISGGPAWLVSQRYEITAKAETPSISPEQLKVLLQSLLADRFKMKFHRETKELPIYAMVVGKDGHKLQKSAKEPEAGQTGSIRMTGAGLVGQMVEVSAIPNALTRLLDRPVVDMTAIKGYYDFTLQIPPEVMMARRMQAANVTVNDGSMLPSAPSGSAIFKAVEDQLGLKLEPKKSPFEILVIDSIEKIAGNHCP